MKEDITETDICLHCGSTGRISVMASISAPSTMAYNFTKNNLRSKNVYLQGVNWETMNFVCGNPECRRSYFGYGNYVSRLQAEVEKLKAEIADLKRAMSNN